MVYIDPKTGKSQPIPEEVKDRIRAYEQIDGADRITAVIKKGFIHNGMNPFLIRKSISMVNRRFMVILNGLGDNPVHIIFVNV